MHLTRCPDVFSNNPSPQDIKDADALALEAEAEERAEALPAAGTMLMPAAPRTRAQRQAQQEAEDEADLRQLQALLAPEAV